MIVGDGLPCDVNDFVVAVQEFSIQVDPAIVDRRIEIESNGCRCVGDLKRSCLEGRLILVLVMLEGDSSSVEPLKEVMSKRTTKKSK